MKTLACPRCQSQFDVSAMQPGSSFVCGKCRNVLQVPAAAPVVQPVPVVQPRPAAPASAAPATVVLSPEDMRRALAAAKGQAEPPKAQPKLPAAMEARRQQQQAQASTRAGGASAAPVPPTPAPAPVPAPRAAAAPRPAAAPAPAARPAAAASAAAAAPTAARATRTAAPAPAAEAPAPRAGRRARRGGDDDGADEAPKPKTGLYVGIGAGALLLVGGAVALFGRGKGTTDDTAQNPATAKSGDAPKTNDASAANAGTGGTATKGADPAATVALDEYDTYLRMTPSQQEADAALKRSQAIGDPEKLRVLYEWFGHAKLATNSVAKSVRAMTVDDALRTDPNTPWANEAKGRKNALELVKKCKEECAKAFLYPEAAEAELDELLKKLEKSGGWVEKLDHAKAEALVARIREREAKLNEDPLMVVAMKKAAWLRDNPLFKNYKFEVRFANPYVICQQYQEFTDENERHKNKDRIANANRLANRDAIIFTELNRYFREMFAEKFNLAKLEDKGRVLFAVITWDNEAFIELHRKAYNGDAPQPWVRAFYSPPEQKIFHYIGTEALTSQDEVLVAKGRIQKVADQVTFHEGTHQLQHEYGAIYRGKPLVDGDQNVLPRKSMWIDEGFAEFMGAVEVDEDKKRDLVGATFYHNRLLGERIMQVVGDGQDSSHRETARKWTIAEMLQPNHNGELLEQSGKLYPTSPVYMANLFYARTWGFVHFLWFYDNGKYRPQFMQWMEKVFKEEHTADAFAKVMGRKNAKDWTGIDKEFEWYWDRICARRFGKKPSGKPWLTETDPPEGKYDPSSDEDEGK